MPAAPPSLPAPPHTAAGGRVDFAAWRCAIEALPFEAREALAHLWAPAANRTARLAERDRLLRMAADEMLGSTREVAATLHQRVSRYAASQWRFDRDREAPPAARNAEFYGVLRACGDESLPSPRTMQRILGA